MDKHPEARPATEPVVQPSAARSMMRGRRLRVDLLFNSAALLATTAVLVAIDPKNPPFRQD